MNSETLRALQSPLKSKYKKNPDSAVVKLSSEGKIGTGVTCKVDTGKALVEAGLHPATGGDGMAVCSGDMLLDALAACAGVTLNAVSTAIGIDLGEETKVTAEGDLDFRGTLGVSKEAPVGFKEIRLTFHLDTNADEEEISTLIKLSERYCVVFQTLNNSPSLITSHKRVS